MGKIDGHQTTDVRAVLEPLADFATNTKVAIFGITHPPKHASGKAINAFTGSLAFIAVARLGFFVLEEPGTDRRLLLPVKNNLGPRAPGLACRLAQRIVSNNIVAPHIVWDSTPVTVTADEAIAAAADSARNASALTEAKDFLVDELADGPRPASDVLKRAEAQGITERTLPRARKNLGVIASKKRVTSQVAGCGDVLKAAKEGGQLPYI
jgi:hypothetical protein